MWAGTLVATYPFRSQPIYRVCHAVFTTSSLRPHGFIRPTDIHILQLAVADLAVRSTAVNSCSEVVNVRIA